MKRSGHAVVVGGSVGGLCVARALSERFERVTVIDRDRFPEGARDRKGVPQARHPHALLDGGRRALERLFPGFESAMLSRGALELDPGFDFALMRPTGWAPRRRSSFTMLFSSRALLESVVRELAAKLGNVRVADGTEVTALVTSREGGLRVAGVATRANGEAGRLGAELVVDTSGRATKAPEWLARLGLPRVEMTIVDADAGYSTRWYQGPGASAWPADWWWKCVWIEPRVDEASRPEEQYFGVLFPVEGDRWIVTLASWGGRELPSDPDSFERLVGKLRSPILAEAIARARAVSPVYFRRGLQNAYRHYERWQATLPGFIATADAVCAFNPVYGQGMSSAAICAEILGRTLERVPAVSPRFPREFFRAQARFLDTPWLMAVSRDLEHPRSEGADRSLEGTVRGLFARLGGSYMQLVALAAAVDEKVRDRLFEVLNLTRPPGDLVRDPRLAARVLVKGLRYRGRLAVPGETIPAWPTGAEAT
jgi:2-polyprenyl-6-methoxyphenol hydroxylase-like FAD-dependent oxidoreductase